MHADRRHWAPPQPHTAAAVSAAGVPASLTAPPTPHQPARRADHQGVLPLLLPLLVCLDCSHLLVCAWSVSLRARMKDGAIGGFSGHDAIVRQEHSSSVVPRRVCDWFSADRAPCTLLSGLGRDFKVSIPKPCVKC